ncbi:MAG: hypothetical protein WHU54_07940 [Candidatus Bathyarchaeia archaeon]
MQSLNMYSLHVARLIFVFAFSLMLTLTFVVGAQPQLVSTDLTLSVEPDVAEKGQQVRISIQVSPAPPAGEVFRGIEIWIYQPDGFTTRHGPFDSFPNCSVQFYFTPTMNGVYTIRVTFPEQALANNTIFYASITETANLTVPPIPPPPSYDGAGKWEKTASMSFERGGLGVAVVGGKIYAMGGSTEVTWPSFPPSVVDVNEMFDPAVGVWVARRAMPTGRAYFGVAVYGGRVYCISGMSGEGPTGVNEVYDPVADVWSACAPLPEEAYSYRKRSRYHYEAAAAVLGDMIHVVVSDGAHYAYDPQADNWIKRAALPGADYNNALVTIDGKLYAISDSHLHIYNAENDSWSELASPPTGLYHAAAAATTGYLAPKMICVFTSDPIPTVFAPCTAGYTYSYFPENDTWVRGANMPTGRLYVGAVAYNDTLYAIGGFTPTFVYFVGASGVVERFLPPGYGMVPPLVRVLSPENTTYATGNVSLVFAVDRPVVWMGYSLNGHARRPVDGNVTLVGLAEGAYALTVYAVDGFGNTAASETVCFAVVNPVKAMLLQALAVILPAAMVIVAVVVIKRYKRRQHQLKQFDVTSSG